ncbi:hypothetical protein DY245_01875 [Streptomyces inhibens]|uniref:Uncharacterized protein n=1 Tax=Streptomyces inhibens TaxID=2293571 RepID=A0A371QAT8_STRIH|nr:hypothetical protein [Streptomyces inhibens]REK91819.1 hypothetical protein DY245_01875 [Streptomyces inhibens]
MATASNAASRPPLRVQGEQRTHAHSSLGIGTPHGIDHCGRYLGPDNDGHRRCCSCRSKDNAPTKGDLPGRATLDGDGFPA